MNGGTKRRHAYNYGIQYLNPDMGVSVAAALAHVMPQVDRGVSPNLVGLSPRHRNLKRN
jgi:hypothetical protein